MADARLWLCAGAMLLCAPALPARAADWSDGLSDPRPGTFRESPPFEAEYRFGWSNVVEAAEATISARRTDTEWRIAIDGRTLGLARTLWRLDATHEAALDRRTFRPSAFRQHEKYRNRTIETQVEFGDRGLRRFRKVSPDRRNVARWKRVNIDPVFDVLGAALLVRSKPLKTGDRIALAVFPGDSPYRVDLTVAKREPVEIGGVSRPAILIDLQIRKIETDGKDPTRLSEFRRFRRGRVWVSDDALRIPLRAEVSIFVGFVYGELVRFE